VAVPHGVRPDFAHQVLVAVFKPAGKAKDRPETAVYVRPEIRKGMRRAAANAGSGDRDIVFAKQREKRRVKIAPPTPSMMTRT